MQLDDVAKNSTGQQPVEDTGIMAYIFLHGL